MNIINESQKMLNIGKALMKEKTTKKMPSLTMVAKLMWMRFLMQNILMSLMQISLIFDDALNAIVNDRSVRIFYHNFHICMACRLNVYASVVSIRP